MFELFIVVTFLLFLLYLWWLLLPLCREYLLIYLVWAHLLWVWIFGGSVFLDGILVGGRMSILWGWCEELCPDIARKSTLSLWLMVVGYPGVVDPLRLVILRFLGVLKSCLLVYQYFYAALGGWGICIGGSWDYDFWDRTWKRYIPRLLWLDLTDMWLWCGFGICSVLQVFPLEFLFW